MLRNVTGITKLRKQIEINEKFSPGIGLLYREMVPPACSMILRDIASPSPIPEFFGAEIWREYPLVLVFSCTFSVIDHGDNYPVVLLLQRTVIFICALPG